jgi:crotonobetainyl-CoA:carnitine CoA-transferase CaiB-like acyl-CoA transferase
VYGQSFIAPWSYHRYPPTGQSNTIPVVSDPSTRDRLPLAGLRVLDAGDFLAAPVCAMVLADWGAEVVKVEPLHGDPSRYMGTLAAEDVSAIFVGGNRGKRSVALDLASPRGRALLRELALGSDIVVHNRGERQAAALGLDYASLSAQRPELIVGSVTAFGDDGPYAGRGGLDLVAQAMSGMMSVTGASDGPPMRGGVTLIDFGTGLALAVAVLAAWGDRLRTGAGRRVATSLLDIGVLYSSSLFPQASVTGVTPPRLENRSHPLISDQFATVDGFVVIAVWDTRRWQALCDVLELPELGHDPALSTNAQRLDQYERLRPQLQRAFARWPAAELVQRLVAVHIPCAQTYDIAQAAADAHIREVGSLYEEDRFSYPVTLAANPLRLDGVRRQHGRRAPHLGEHTAEVLSELLGIDSAEIAQLRHEGTISG